MGQYYMIVNIDKKEFIHPHKFGDGLKLLEFGDSMGGTMTALAILLADGNNRGGGDLRSDKEIIGSWAGDRIVIAGDYADEGKFLKGKKENLHSHAYDNYKDISDDIIIAMLDDEYLKKNLQERAEGYLIPETLKKETLEAIKSD